MLCKKDVHVFLDNSQLFMQTTAADPFCSLQILIVFFFSLLNYFPLLECRLLVLDAYCWSSFLLCEVVKKKPWCSCCVLWLLLSGVQHVSKSLVALGMCLRIQAFFLWLISAKAHFCLWLFFFLFFFFFIFLSVIFFGRQEDWLERNPCPYQ